MSRRDNDPVGHMPRMAPAHDEIASFKRNKGLASSLGDVPNVEGAGSSSGVGGLWAFMVVLLLATAGGAGYLYIELKKAEDTLNLYSIRLGDLERRLSVTDESMSESSVAMKVKVREMDSEIRKLWDNVWKKSKQRFGEYDVKFATLEKGLKRNDNYAATVKQQLSQNKEVVSQLSTQLKNVDQLKSTMTSNKEKLSLQEGYIESANDKANQLVRDVSKLDRRVKSTEEWVESINGFRKQVNRDLGALKRSVGKLENASTAVQSPTTP